VRAPAEGLGGRGKGLGFGLEVRGKGLVCRVESSGWSVRGLGFGA
jgi:hypothetical protein